MASGTAGTVATATVQARDLVMAALPGPTLDAGGESLLRDGCAGGVCLYGRNVVDPAQLLALTDSIRAIVGRDALVACDLEGGHVWRLRPPATHWPSAMAFGAANRPDLTRRAATMAAREFRAMGIDAPFAPVADVNDHPRNPVIGTRAFGSTPALVARHVTAAIGGYREGGVASCTKHFPGHGHTDTDSHHALPVLAHDRTRLDSIDLVPFGAAIRAGVDMVMVAHLLVRAIDGENPASLSPAVVTGLLRERLGFRGVIVSDALDMRAIADTYGLGEAAVRAVAAGCDLVAFNAPIAEARKVHDALAKAIESGRLPPVQVAASVARVRAMRRALNRNPRPPLEIVGDPSHVATADEVARRALTSTGATTGWLATGVHPIPGGVVVIEFDPRLPFADPNVHAPPLRMADALRERLPEATALILSPAEWVDRAPEALAAIAGAGRVIVATRNAWKDERQRTAIAAIAETARQLAVIALRDPQDAMILPGAISVATYGDDAASVRAALAWLLDGVPAPGTLATGLS